MIKQISVGFREDQLTSLSELAGEHGVSQAEIVRRMVDEVRKSKPRLHELSLAFLRGQITEDEFAREVSVIVLS